MKDLLVIVSFILLIISNTYLGGQAHKWKTIAQQYEKAIGMMEETVGEVEYNLLNKTNRTSRKIETWEPK